MVSTVGSNDPFMTSAAFQEQLVTVVTEQLEKAHL